MAGAPTAAQRRIVMAADPETGRLGGTAAQLAALVRLGLAWRHPRPPHACFLTPQGRRAREAWLRGETGPQPAPDTSRPKTSPAGPADPAGPAGPAGPLPPGPAPQPAPADTGFAARTGDEPDAPPRPSARAREVRTAWAGLLELRRMTHPDAATDRPCPWERAHLVRAAALALEAGGCPPATAGTGGYRVTGTPQPEAVAVHAPDPGALDACARVLRQAGWQPGEHRDPHTGERFLLASPRRR